MRLVVSREPVIADAVQVAQTRTEAAGEVLRLHTVHHVHTGLTVLGGAYQDQVLAKRVLRVAHQHALVARLRKGGIELVLAYQDGITLHGSDLHPVAFQAPAAERGAAHQVMGGERVLLLEGDFPVTVLRYGGLDLPVGCTHAQLAADTADFLDEQFQYHHPLPHRQLVDGKVRQRVLHPKPPALAEKAVHELGAAQQRLHD